VTGQNCESVILYYSITTSLIE